MAVLAPLNSAENLERLRDAGVSEVYVGFHDDAWTERFGTVELNRMSGFGEEANPFSFGEMCRQLERAHDLGMQAYVCFNASQYSPEQLDFMARNYLPAIAAAHGRGVILSSQGLIEQARLAGLDAVVSTVAGVFNARLAEHYRQRGATRLILPRDLSSDEIAGIVHAVPDLEYEVFLMRNGCVFSDSHCLGRHCAGRPSLCLSLREGEMRIAPSGMLSSELSDMPQGLSSAGFQQDVPQGFSHDFPQGIPRGTVGDADDFIGHAYESERIWAQIYHRRTCGLCTLWRFEQLGIAAYKVVGRGDDVDDLVADAGLVARNTALARACATEGEYFAKMERPRDPETLCGTQGLSCYYPEASCFEGARTE